MGILAVLGGLCVVGLSGVLFWIMWLGIGFYFG
jgi:hypothetical protein